MNRERRIRGRHPERGIRGRVKQTQANPVVTVVFQNLQSRFRHAVVLEHRPLEAELHPADLKAVLDVIVRAVAAAVAEVGDVA